MAFRLAATSTSLASGLSLTVFLAAGVALPGTPARAQVFVVGEKTATADISTSFHPTRVELPSTPLTERGRRDLIRNLEDEQGFAHRALPLGTDITLIANGNLTPNGDDYKQLLFKKGQSAAPGDRVAITTVTVKEDRIILDLNGGPYLKHRFLRHIDLNDTPLVADNGEQVTGCRVTLLFEGGIPDLSAPEVKALLDPLVDFGVKSGAQAYADTLPPFLKEAIAQHEVLVGMNRKMVIAAMGAPETKVRELVPGSTDKHYEEWIYGAPPQTVRFVRFNGDQVVQLRVAAQGKPIAIYDKNQMEGYSSPDNVREIAMGDDQHVGDDTQKGPPTILKPGENAPGASQRVRLPVPDTTQDKKTSSDDGSAPPADSTGSASSPANASPDNSAAPASDASASAPDNASAKQPVGAKDPQ